MADIGAGEVALVQLQEDSSHPPTRIKVSSVLNRDVKQFGKKFMFDGDEETCWNSDQGSPQFVSIELPYSACVSRVHIRFQGGFASTHCILASGSEQHSFYPEDINSLQVFPVPSAEPSKTHKIEFRTSTDFYGRLTVYQLQLYGQVCH
ncbi:nuclear receptor 2C2-associated protein-like [Halichondria panicea]|uniref:nuclear receptor 2C2-associated protein-like n=1 Tax=Halichondria panicea TaxID=6063 RepID=UPI00312B414A